MPGLDTKVSTLIVKSSQGATQEIEVSKPTFSIGRKPDNDLVLEDPSVSGHHARIVKIQEVRFLEDLASTNGTHVNEHKIDRKQLQDADVIRIGTYRIIFRHEDVDPSVAPTAPRSTSQIDRTVVCASPISSSNIASSMGTIRVLAGKTDQPRYTLTKQRSMIGAREDAAIKLTGWFAPKSAATIGRLGQDYTLSMGESGKTVRINGMSLRGQATLSDGDVIEVAGVTLEFHRTEPRRR